LISGLLNRSLRVGLVSRSQVNITNWYFDRIC